MPWRKAIDNSIRVVGAAAFKTCRQFSPDFFATDTHGACE